MAAMQNVEAEAAKFLQKLIHESKDEPAKLATKLYVILQHMTASGKENSMPYQVISKAMETVINDHGLDFEALKSSRLPTSGGPQIGESSQSQSAGSKLTTGVANESKSGLKESNLTRADALSSSLPPAGSYVAGHPHQVPASHRRGTSLDNESPSSLDTRSGDSYSQDRRDRGSWEQQANQKETKQPTTKRKKSGSTSVIEPHTNTSEYLEAHGQGADMRQGKLVNKIEPGSFPGPAVNFQAGSTGVSNSYMAVGGFSGTPSFGPSGKIPVDSEYWKPAFNGANANFPERPVQGHVFSTQLGEEAKPTVSNPASRSVVENAGSSSNMSMDADRVVQGAAVNTLNEMNMLRGAASGDSAKSVVLPIPSAPGMPFKEHHLKQLRAQCLVFLAFRNGIMPKRMHLEIALGSNLQTEGNNFDGASRDSVDSRGKEQTGVEPNKAIQEKIIHGGKGLRHETVNGGHAHADNPFSTPLQPYQGSNMEQEKIMPANDAKTLGRHGLPGQTVNNGNQYSSLGKRSSEFDEEALPRIDASLPSAEYTTSEYWIMVHQKRRLVSRQSWVKKQEKANQSIRSRFNELKETVSSSEDISAKTKSVIELKKLQLIELQRRLRSNLMNDFFKVIKPEIDYLKGIKKHRIGRRLKQVEKYEQRMKEERQKRIRERQKEFFSELELHKDRLEDLFKFKRERGRGFNKYVKEFHKRKERIHREKIDRIQREKINLLKINDVEGYLRMVQDAKSDRVKQLLKETEKYLQKLGSKLQEAKTVARLFEAEMDEDSSSSI
ncbi:Chromatin structure-remodeling complex protein SYD-like protein, partial [Drosera capensis]